MEVVIGLYVLFRQMTIADRVVSSLYCHVKTNDYLHAGEPLGLTGNTGASTGEHLHLTTKKDGKAFDPTILIDYVRSVKNSCLNDLAF